MCPEDSKFRLPIEYDTESERHHTISEAIRLHKDDFTEWYMPLQLGQHVINVRTYPSFKDRPAENAVRGINKWNTVIKDNLPDLSNKRVCDLGCNIGVFSLEMARSGAKSVDGFDRGENIRQPNNHKLGAQSVAKQAEFVRALYEAFYGERYHQVRFYEADLMTMDFSERQWDLVIGCCVLYHLGAKRMEDIIRLLSCHTPEIFLQANNGHGGELGLISNAAHHIHLLKKHRYEIIRVAGDIQPVIYAKRKM